ncbi:hypothetical protein Bca4012_007265 [Brassica carinata]|uniref:Uncharacterized protein n=3 Tax=Brassica TaxID=3705 RepID=A0ABQ8ANI9_BRANA|nr:hypothetical protein Bca52824_037982 [Brassica carinata]KAH0894114.1 hypothetical protein HID58_056543 [Brassica napus]
MEKFACKSAFIVFLALALMASVTVHSIEAKRMLNEETSLPSVDLETSIPTVKPVGGGFGFCTPECKVLCFGTGC